MARDTINITGESGRDIIDDDAEATLTLRNTNTTVDGGGIGLSIESDGDHALDLRGVSNPTIAPLRLGASAASGAVMEIESALISTASLTVHAGGIPVRLANEDKVVYLVGYEIS